MKTTKPSILVAAALVALGVTASPGAARAAGLETSAASLAPATATSLRGDIERARAQVPHLFRAVAQTVLHAAEIDARSRVRGAPFTPRLKALGPNALMPMLEVIAFDDARVPRDLPVTARSALRVGLIEAVGSIRDPRAVPVLDAVLRGASDVRVVRAASAALSRIGNDDAVEIVSRAATEARQAPRGAARERAILSGMHDCRREAAARYLASRLDASTDDETARVVVRALGGAANAWAWRAMSDRAEESATRALAADTLLRVYVDAARSRDVREAAAKALLVVDAPATARLIARARSSANADLTHALDDLERRFAAHPARLSR